MSNSVQSPGVVAGRLPKAQIAQNFCDLHEPLSPHEARVASDRCYFCHDAPCITACPTDIDIPLFIREIQTGNVQGAARTILSQNILGGMCARVCPTETLCEEACVRHTAEDKPVEIGRLQRFATDALMQTGAHPFTRAPASGKSVAVVGAGPAGLACAHRLALLGHDVTLLDARSKPGGLNEFGIAAYKSVDDFAAAETNWLLSIGGIELRTGQRLGESTSLEALQQGYDAVFLGVGLGGVNGLGLRGCEMDNVTDAVDFISQLRQSGDLSTLKVGRDVVVIGGGMTAVDAAVQARLLGAENVTIAYRRDQDRMGASRFEQDLATSRGVRILTNLAPVALQGDGAVEAVELAYTQDTPEGLRTTDQTIRLAADQVFTAIGQVLDGAPEGIDISGGKIVVTGAGRTSVSGVWAGGDCASGGDDLTVTAVAEGRDAAEDIHAALSS